MSHVQSLKQNAINLLPHFFCSTIGKPFRINICNLVLLPWLKWRCLKHACLLSFLPTYMQVSTFICWRASCDLPLCCLCVDVKFLCFICKYFSFMPPKYNPFFFTEMLWYGNTQNMVWFQMRYTNFLVLGMKILLSGNTFCVKWWICSCDLCKWLSGGFVAHPILAVKYSFLVTSDILDEFPWLANVLHNCQNFAMVFLRNIEKGEFSSTSRFFWTGFFFFFFSLQFSPVHLSSPVIFCKPLSLLC